MLTSDKAKQFFQQITNSLSEGVIVINKMGEIQAVNSAVTSLFGYSQEELIGNNVKKLMPRDHASEHDSYISRYRQTGERKILDQGRDLKGRDKDGILFPLNLKVSELDFDGEPFYLGTITSLIDQTSNLRRLKRQSDLLEQAEMMAQVGHWRVDINLQTVFWSKEIYRIHGVTPKTYTPELDSAIDFYHPDDREMVRASVAKSIETGEKIGFEARIVRPSGEVRVVRSSGECTRNEDEIILFGVFKDITDEVSTLRELEDRNKFQTLVMESNPDLLFVKDSLFRIVRANQAFINVYPEEMRDKVIGYTTLESYSEEEAEGFLYHDKLAFEEGVSETEESVTFPDGQTRILLTKKVRFEDGNGDAYILGIGRDITKIKQAEVALKQANDELKEFAYRTSHDLRSPIVSTISLLGMAKTSIEQDDKATTNQALDLSLSSLGKLDSLIKDLLTLTKARNQVEEESSANIVQITHDALEKFAHMDNFRRLEITNEINFTEDLLLKKSRLVLIIENLISNAIKYQDLESNESFVKISCTESDGRVVFSVEDNGMGIPEEQQQKMFQMFQRFHTKVSYGSGLGLYMIKKSADILGAAIQFEGLDKGSKFSLSLPKK